MRVLLDEQLDWRISLEFDPDFDVIHVKKRGWSGKKNGELLRLAEAEFDAFVTMDKNLEHQQNLVASKLKIVVIHAVSNRRAVIAPFIPSVMKALRSLKPGQLVIVDQ